MIRTGDIELESFVRTSGHNHCVIALLEERRYISDMRIETEFNAFIDDLLYLPIQ